MNNNNFTNRFFKWILIETKPNNLLSRSFMIVPMELTGKLPWFSSYTYTLPNHLCSFASMYISASSDSRRGLNYIDISYIGARGYLYTNHLEAIVGLDVSFESDGVVFARDRFASCFVVKSRLRRRNRSGPAGLSTPGLAIWPARGVV